MSETVVIFCFRSVIQVFKKHSPDEVYNLAGQSSVGLSFEQPVETFESISIAVCNKKNSPGRLSNCEEWQWRVKTWKPFCAEGLGLGAGIC